MAGPLITTTTSPTTLVEDEYFSESPLVTIVVGNGDRKFSVHKNILVSQSKYFAAALSNPLASETQTNQILLKQDDGHEANAFGSVVDWLYGGHASLSKVAPMKHASLPANRQAQVALTKVYIQAHRLMIPKLQNQILTDIIRFSVITLPSLEALSMVHDAISIGTPLEAYYLECLAFWFRTGPDYLRYNVNGWHVEANRYLTENSDLAFLALKKVCEASASGPPVNPNNPKTLCKYHEHDGNTPMDNMCLLLAPQGFQVPQHNLDNGVGVGLIMSGYDYAEGDDDDGDEGYDYDDYDGDFDAFLH